MKENHCRHDSSAVIWSRSPSQRSALLSVFYHRRLFGHPGTIFFTFCKGWLFKITCRPRQLRLSPCCTESANGKMCVVHPENNSVGEVHPPASRPVPRVVVGPRNLENRGRSLIRSQFSNWWLSRICSPTYPCARASGH